MARRGEKFKHYDRCGAEAERVRETSPLGAAACRSGPGKDRRNCTKTVWKRSVAVVPDRVRRNSFAGLAKVESSPLPDRHRFSGGPRRFNKRCLAQSDSRRPLSGTTATPRAHCIFMEWKGVPSIFKQLNKLNRLEERMTIERRGYDAGEQAVMDLSPASTQRPRMSRTAASSRMGGGKRARMSWVDRMRASSTVLRSTWSQ